MGVVVGFPVSTGPGAPVQQSPLRTRRRFVVPVSYARAEAVGARTTRSVTAYLLAVGWRLEPTNGDAEARPSGNIGESRCGQAVCPAGFAWLLATWNED